MGEGILSDCHNLTECEDILFKLVEPGEILGKAPFSETDWVYLGVAFRAIIKVYGENDGTNKIWAHYPTCAAFYLVHAGIRRYAAGEFWPKLQENIKITQNYTGVWGQRFIAFLVKNNLPTFADTGGYRYITPILSNGGIPNYCLPDFFKYVLSKAMDINDISSDDILDDLLESSRFSVDKPVQRFLAYGGDYAVDFINRCLEMAYECKNSLPENFQDSFGLPVRIFKEYIKWSQREVAVSSDNNSQHLRSPSITFQPYGLGIVLHLPTQRLNTFHSFAIWKITSDRGFHKKIKCNIRFDGAKYEMQEQEIPLLPAGKYQVALTIDDEEFREWLFLIPNNKPYIAFSPYNGKLIRTDGLNGEETWLLIKVGWDVELGESWIVEEFPPLGSHWREYRAVMVKFERSIQLNLNGPNQQSCTIPILNKIVKPRLVGGKVFANSNQTDCLIYSPQLPTIRFPFSSETHIFSDWLNKWHIYIHYDDKPENAKSIRLVEYIDELVNADHCYLLPLDLPGLLEKKFGKIKVKIKGPMGYDANLQFIAFPDVHLRIKTSNIWPVGLAGSKKLEFSWTMPDNYGLSLSNKTCTVIEKKEVPGNKITIWGEMLENSIAFKGELHNGSDSYYFEKNIRPVKWGWIGLDEKGIVQWENQIRKINILEWEKNQDSILVLQFSEDIGEGYRGELSLRDVSNSDLYKINFDMAKTSCHKFTLSRWKDTVAASNSRIFRFWVTVFLKDQLITEFCPAEVIKTWVASNVKVLPGGMKGIQFDRCYVSWEENFKIPDKEIKIWSVWRPWEEPITYPIEGEDTFSWINFSSEALTPGIYRYEVKQKPILDDFSDIMEEEKFPFKQASNIVDFNIKASMWHEYFLSLPHGVSRELEIYLAYYYPSESLRIHEQDIIVAEFSNEEARQFIQTIQIITSEYNNNPVVQDYLNYMRPYLTEQNLLVLLKNLALWVYEGKTLNKTVLVGLGLDKIAKNVDIYSKLENWETEALWSIWPALGFLADLNGGKYSSLNGNMERHFSKSGLELLFGRPASAPFRVANGKLCELDLGPCLIELFNFNCICNSILTQVPNDIIGDFNSANLIAQKSYEELDSMYSNLNLFPEGFFHKDFVIDEIFKWLINMKKNGQEEKYNNLTRKYIGLADKILELCLNNEVINKDVVKTIEKRKYQRKGSLPLVNFPYTVAACALGRRLQARNLINDGNLSLEELTIEIIQTCPDLYGHDLCLIEILLNIWL